MLSCLNIFMISQHFKYRKEIEELTNNFTKKGFNQYWIDLKNNITRLNDTICNKPLTDNAIKESTFSLICSLSVQREVLKRVIKDSKSKKYPLKYKTNIENFIKLYVFDIGDEYGPIKLSIYLFISSMFFSAFLTFFYYFTRKIRKSTSEENPTN